MTRLLRFHGGPADGRELEVPALSVGAQIHVKAFADGVVIFLDEREGTTTYDWISTDGQITNYEVADG